jgi:hypothetical protein
MRDPASHSPVIRGTASAAPSLLRASAVERVGIAVVLASALWLAVFWALDQAVP